MMQYPVNLVREGSKTLVSFSDFPNVHTYGDDEEEALTRAVYALVTYLMSMIEDREPIPWRPAAGRRYWRHVEDARSSAQRLAAVDREATTERDVGASLLSAARDQ